jgi:hypothetical protein
MTVRRQYSESDDPMAVLVLGIMGWRLMGVMPLANGRLSAA